MEITVKDARTIMGLMSVAELERGLSPAEKVLCHRIFQAMPEYAREVLEDKFFDDTWAGATEEAEDVRALREELELFGERIEGRNRDRFEELSYLLQDSKHLVHERILATVREGWVF